MFPYIANTQTLTVFLDGAIRTMPTTDPQFPAVLAAVRNGDDETVRNALTPPVIKAISANPRFTLQHNTVFLDGRPQNDYAGKKLLELYQADIPATPLENFLVKAEQNPSRTSRQDLYRFMEVNSLPLTPDGDFLAYKRVRNDFMDCYSGTLDNTPGQTVSMPRNEVTDDRNETCSYGLHVCSLAYLAHFNGARLVAVKVNPQDVVSVPIDYNDSKMRVCRYEVIQELPNDLTQDYWHGPVADQDEVDESDQDDEADNECTRGWRY